MSDNRPNVYEENGVVIYRASSVGMCVRALVAIGRDNYEEALGKDRSDLLSRTADEGDIHEEAIRNKLVKEGWTLKSAQDVVEIPIIKGVIVRGHTDGILTPPENDLEYRPREHLLEAKSMSNKRFDRWVRQGFDGFLKNAYQISCYMEANKGRDVVYVVKRREDGFEARQVIHADNPPIPFKEVRKRVLVAESHRRKRGSFPACDIPKDEVWLCQFWYLHDEAEISDDESPMSDEDYAVLADILPKRFELKEIEDQGKIAEKERKSLDKEILNLMGATDQTIINIDGDDFQITRVKSGGTSLDQSKLRADLGEEILKYESSYRYQYPKITQKKKQPKKGTTK